jgi:hypothetical protein
MTWSIIARDPATGQFGIAVATRFFAVGARVPYIAAGLGAIATQAFVNPYYGIDGVKLLREGLNVHDVLAALLATDNGRERRDCRAYRPRLRRLVWPHRGQRVFDCRQYARRRRRTRRNRKNLHRQ